MDRSPQPDEAEEELTSPSPKAEESSNDTWEYANSPGGLDAELEDKNPSESTDPTNSDINVAKLLDPSKPEAPRTVLEAELISYASVLKEAAPTPDRTSAPAKEPPSKDMSDGLANMHQCNLCLKFFASRWSLKKHAKIHTGEKPFRCNLCTASFTCANALKNHVMLHTGQRPFECDECPKSFRSRFELKQHKFLHSGEKPFECCICHKQFTRSSYLTSHLRVHTGEKPYECEVCKKSFADRRTLERHGSVHTGLKPFRCDYCHKTFTQRGHCRTHMKMHLGLNLFTCEVCGRAYPFQCYLNRHMKIHTGDKPYECTICNKKFVRHAHLRLHMPIHTEEKPFECHICHTKFARPYSLKIHVQKHDNIRVTCDLCPATFGHRTNLNKHKRQVHKIFKGPPGPTAVNFEINCGLTELLAHCDVPENPESSEEQNIPEDAEGSVGETMSLANGDVTEHTQIANCGIYKEEPLSNGLSEENTLQTGHSPFAMDLSVHNTSEIKS